MAVVEHWAEEMETGNKLPHLYDVLIVGAGPCGLAVAARLREGTPSALFTDVEHARYHWMSHKAPRLNAKTTKSCSPRQISRSCSELSMVVIDSSGSDWLTKWNRHFQNLQISHLRSPMFFHPDPRDRDGLLAFAHEHGRSCDCIEIRGCVGKEISKHQRKKQQNAVGKGRQAIIGPGVDRREEQDYYAPPSDLFSEYCDCIAGRYNLCGKELIKHESIIDIDFDKYAHLDDSDKFFAVSSSKSTYFARTVVLAVGAGGRSSIPQPFTPASCHCACHALDIATNQLLHIGANMNILIIGGGLTGAQMADIAVQRGCKVWMLIRGRLMVKPFDVDLAWMGKYKNQEKASFWSADTDRDRLAMIKEARGGGSITPRYHKILQQHIQTCQLCLHSHTSVVSQSFDPTTETYKVTTEPRIPELPRFHRVCFATGVQSNVGKLTFLRTLQTKEPIEICEGLPALTDELKWKHDVPLFVTGKLAGLRLGPGAGNLEGARSGAERIAWALDELLSPTSEHRVETRLKSDHWRFMAGIGSRFESLSTE